MGSVGDYDVFVSYARSDGAAASELNGWLCAQGLRTFFDRSALRPGLRWVPALEEAIGRSKAVAIFVGPHGIGNTQQYERELALIRQTGDKTFPVIPVLLPGCDSPPTGFLQLLTWVDLSKGKSVREQTESLESLRAALRGATFAVAAVRGSICPYRGLEPFREEDAAFFCGRDDAIRELVERVQQHAFVAVVGPSGSGKSSLVFAGLLPALRKRGRTAMWDVVALRPGKSPLTALAQAFGAPPENAGPAAIDAWLEGEAAAYRAGDAETLVRIVDRRLDDAPEKPDRLLIYVDQWEELYAMAPPPEDRGRLKQHSADVKRFIELLIVAVSSAGSRLTVVMTVRADFYNPLIRDPQLASLLPKQQVNIPPMGRDDLRSAIETPAKTAGLAFAPLQLVDRILDDVGLEEGRLPLLQFALKETWQKREDNRLAAEAYTAVGGVAGAIEKTAEDAYERLTPAQKDAARRLFLGLVTPGEGQADTRARSVFPNDPQQREIISLFADPKTRLLVTGYETLHGTARAGIEARSTVEVAHEALIQRWKTLRDWVGANRQKLRDRAAIVRAKAEWEEQGKAERFLLDPGVQLERGRALINDPGDVRIDDVHDYVSRSIERDRRRVDAEREAALADQKRIADAERRAREAAERTIAEQKRAAAHFGEAQIAQSRFLADLARQKREAGDVGAAVLLALEALPDTDSGTDRPYVPEAELQLDAGWRNLRERFEFAGHKDRIVSALFSPDGRRVITASADCTARVWDATCGKPIGEPLRHAKEVTSASFSPDGRLIITASGDAARIWIVSTGKPIGDPLRGHNKSLTHVEFSPDGCLIVTASLDKTARVWSASTGEPMYEPLKGHGDTVNSAAFSNDGKRIVTASMDNTARIWDVASGSPVGPPIGEPLKGQKDAVWTWLREAATGRSIRESLTGSKFGLNSAAFSPDGKRIVTASMDNTARIWDAESGEPVGELLEGHDGALLSASFSPEGQRVITASVDKTARIWDAVSMKQIGEPFAGHEDGVTSAAFSRDGQRVVTGSLDKTARVWDAGRGTPVGGSLTGHRNAVNWAAFSPDGRRIVTASADWTARIWDATIWKPIGVALEGHRDELLSATFAPNGQYIVTTSADYTARVWDAASGKSIGEPLIGHDGTVLSAAFSPDGSRIVTASADYTARIWAAATGESIGKPLRGHGAEVLSAVFTPDGQRIVTASDDRTTRVWDAASGMPIGEPLMCQYDILHSAAFSPDCQRIVTASDDKTACIWDAATGEPIGEPLRGHSGDVHRAVFSPDGKRIITASHDQTARLWDSETGKPIGEPLAGHGGPVHGAAFSPDGKRIVTASADKTARVWEVFPDTQSLVSAAKAAVPRALTRSQRKAFFLPPEPPEWCIEMRKWPYDTPEWKQWLADKRAGTNPPLPAAP